MWTLARRRQRPLLELDLDWTADRGRFGSRFFWKARGQIFLDLARLLVRDRGACCLHHVDSIVPILTRLVRVYDVAKIVTDRAILLHRGLGAAIGKDVIPRYARGGLNHLAISGHNGTDRCGGCQYEKRFGVHRGAPDGWQKAILLAFCR